MAGLSTGGNTSISAVRRKQLLLLAVGAVILGAIALMAGFLGTPKKPAQAPVVETTRKAFGAPGENANPADLWQVKEGARVTELQAQLNELSERMKAKEKYEADNKRREEEDAARRAKEEKEREQARAKAEQAPKAPEMVPPTDGLPKRGELSAMPPAAPERVMKGIMRIDVSSSAGKANGTNTNTPRANTRGQSADESSDAMGQNAETYIPAGSFMRGVLLSGLDAPTGGQAQNNPHPVIIEVLDLASLPNKFKADYKSCRFTANGAGDISSERAYIRLDRLSCIAEDGGALDIGVKGYIADQTGKAGVRGRLVSKQGQVLANALLAGIASGMGTAFANNSTVTSTSALGSTTTVKDGEQFQAGVGQGVGQAMQQLSKYYIQLAEKMFPIIEIDAGQAVDIVITRGVEITRRSGQTKGSTTNN